MIYVIYKNGEKSNVLKCSPEVWADNFKRLAALPDHYAYLESSDTNIHRLEDAPDYDETKVHQVFEDVEQGGGVQ